MKISNIDLNLSPKAMKSSGQSKTLQMHHQSNFLYDMILPNTLNIENIRIIKKHTASNSPETISKKITEMKRDKLQKKIELIVKKNTEEQLSTMNQKPKLKKYNKQNIKKVSKFAQDDKYKQQLFEGNLSVDKMKFSTFRDTLRSSRIGSTEGKSKDKENSCLANSRLIGSNNMADSVVEGHQDSPFVIDFDEKLLEMRRMEEENFEPFKEKVKKVIEKTISKGKNPNFNALMEKVNFYLTSVSDVPSKERYKRITVDVNQKCKKTKSYSEQIEKGYIHNSERKRLNNSTQMIKYDKQHRSSSTLTKTRPQTALMSNLPTTNQFQTTTRSLSTSQLNRYTICSSDLNNVKWRSSNKEEKQRFSSLLREIEDTCWESKVSTSILEKKLNKLGKEWNIDEDGFRVIEHRRMGVNNETLSLLKRIREKSHDVEKLERTVMDCEGQA